MFTMVAIVGTVVGAVVAQLRRASAAHRPRGASAPARSVHALLTGRSRAGGHCRRSRTLHYHTLLHTRTSTRHRFYSRSTTIAYNMINFILQLS